MNDLERRVQDLEREIVELKQGIYNFSDRQEWTKKLKVPSLETTDVTLTGDLTVNGTINAVTSYESNGTAGATTVFSTSPAVTVTVQDGLIISVV